MQHCYPLSSIIQCISYISRALVLYLTAQNGCECTAPFSSPLPSNHFWCVASNFLEEEKPAGNYNFTVKLHAKPKPDCDPTKGPCEMWLPGVYNVTFGKPLQCLWCLVGNAYSTCCVQLCSPLSCSHLQWRVWQQAPTQQGL